MDEQQRASGVITTSAGNHAQGLAYAASVFNVCATVVMNENASPLKIEKTRDYGAEVVLIPEKNTFPTTLSIAKERGMTLVHPFDDLDLITGHASIGLEIIEEFPDVDVIITPIGGGGLISGLATGVKLLKPEVKIIGVEPEGAPAMWRSIKEKKVVPPETMDTIAAGLAPPFVGEHNFRIVETLVDEVVLVSDDEIVEALLLTLEHTKILTEPSGAASVAALLFDKVTITSNSNVLCVLSGGNVDRNDLKGFLKV